VFDYFLSTLRTENGSVATRAGCIVASQCSAVCALYGIAFFHLKSRTYLVFFFDLRQVDWFLRLRGVFGGCVHHFHQ
jgi:hypothetical protein